ncbi:MAG TPA: efflux RND transporter periplasmic adaptor subunit, partial [Crenotrichaceae bacterium]|nr:efflux RND transporter periplasmic adaptor subunit [Crenotrichaceae bacterium]
MKSENTSHWRRWLLPVVFILAGILLYSVLMFFKKEPSTITTRNKIWPVNVMSIKLQSHTPVLTLYGVVENPGTLTITAPGSSYITQLPVQEGQIV